MLFAFLAHALNLGFVQSRRILDGDGRGFIGCLVLGCDMKNAVGIDVEDDIDLRNPPRCRWNAGQLEGSQRLIISHHFAFALHDVNLNCGLVVLGRGEGLGLLCRNRRIALDQWRCNAADGFNGQRKWRDV